MANDRAAIEAVGSTIVDSCLRVHRQLGPGLLESAYQACLTHELRRRGLVVACEVELPVHYEGLVVPAGYRLDMLVAGSVIVENKAVQALLPVHEAQLLTYLRLSDRRLGYLVNWNVPLIKDGIRRIANDLR